MIGKDSSLPFIKRGGVLYFVAWTMSVLCLCLDVIRVRCCFCLSPAGHGVTLGDVDAAGIALARSVGCQGQQLEVSGF